jgi:hypothetical protein
MKKLKNSSRAVAPDKYEDADDDAAKSVNEPCPEAMDAVFKWLKELALSDEHMLRKLGWNGCIALGRIRSYIALVELKEE